MNRVLNKIKINLSTPLYNASASTVFTFTNRVFAYPPFGDYVITAVDNADNNIVIKKESWNKGYEGGSIPEINTISFSKPGSYAIIITDLDSDKKYPINFIIE
jgi:hypothetical protein